MRIQYRPSPHHYRGMTLMELMVVVLIASIVMAAASPTFTSTAARRVIDAEAQQLEDGLRYARGEAVSRFDTVVLTLTSGTPAAPGTTTFKKESELPEFARHTHRRSASIDPATIVLRVNQTGQILIPDINKSEEIFWLCAQGYKSKITISRSGKLTQGPPIEISAPGNGGGC